MADGPTSTPGIPVFAYAQVLNWDAENHQIYIQLRSLQGPIMPCRVLIDGPADSYYVEQKPLPRRGTWGLVAFPSGDDRTPIWLGSYYSNLVNAFTSSASNSDAEIEYKSHFSGQYDLLDGQGNRTIRLADGTLILANENGLEAQTFRHVIDGNQNQVRVQVQDTERNVNPPANPFYIEIIHPSGVSFIITPDGTITLTGARSTNGAKFQIKKDGTVTLSGGNGNDVLVINPDGTWHLNAAEGGSGGPASIQVDSHDNIILTSNGALNFISDLFKNATLDLILTFLNTHTHQVLNIQTGSSTVVTTAPNAPAPIT